MNNPLISVLIPTFRRPRLLKRAIDSVLSQTYEHFQIYIFDDASADETPKVAAAYRDGRVHYHAHAKNIGISSNYNYALNKVETPLFVFLSDDDFFMPSFLEEAVKAFAQYPDAGVFVGEMIYIDEKMRIMGVTAHDWSLQPYYSPENMIDAIAQGHFSSLINAMVFRKSVRDKVGLFNEKIWLDIDFVTRVLVAFPSIVSQTACMCYQLHTQNISKAVSLDEYWDMKATMRDTIINAGRLPREKQVLIEALTREMRNFFYYVSYDRFVTRRFRETLQAIDILQKLGPLRPIEKLIKWLSKLFIKIKILAYLFTLTVSCNRGAMRVYHFYKLKKKLGSAYCGFLKQKKMLMAHNRSD